MKKQFFYRFNWVASVLVLVLTVVSCTNMGSAPPPADTATTTSLPASLEEGTSTPLALPTQTLEQHTYEEPHEEPHDETEVNLDVLYEDEFGDPSSGWPQEMYDNYFIGYHEPDYYHVQVQSTNDRTLVPLPEKPQFGDITIEVKVFADQDNTATEGDYLYGPVFRRSGNQYYAFTISPSTKKWYVLKNSPVALEVLSEGTDDSIQGQSLATEDTLRVDTMGSNFFFHVNDQLVEQLSDPDYSSGEVGFYVQTFDSTRVHAHFDSITIREVQLPFRCEISATTLYLRSGPGKTFGPITFLVQGTQLEPLGRSPDGEWLLVRVDGENQQGWVSNSANWVSCNIAVADLTVIEP